MNDRERIKRMLPFMEAYAQGKDVQVCGTDDGSWVSLPLNGKAMFDGAPEDYRIRPQPREVFGVYDAAGNLERLTQNSPIPSCSEHRVVRFREVLDE